MGNCQAVDAAALVVQHTNGKVERMYWPVKASEVMKMNPDHYVSLIIPLPDSEQENKDEKTVRFTRVKLLRPTDTLVLGHAYRLVSSEEVMKVLRAKKFAKTKKTPESGGKAQTDMENEEEAGKSEMGRTSQGMRHEIYRKKSRSANFAASRSKSWRPSLQSISESSGSCGGSSRF